MNNSDTIRDILIGKGTLKGYFERLVSVDDVEDCIEMEEIDCISEKSSITFKMSRNNSTEETDYIKSSLCDIDFDDENLKTILEGMFPENSVDFRSSQIKKPTTRITFLLPNRASYICSNKEDEEQEFESNWDHFHIDAFDKEWPSSKRVNYCARIIAALYEMGLAGKSFRPDKSGFLPSIIKTSFISKDSGDVFDDCSLANYFHIYKKDDVKEYKSIFFDLVSGKRVQSLINIRNLHDKQKYAYKSFFRKRIGSRELFNNEIYNCFIDFNELNGFSFKHYESEYAKGIFSLKKSENRVAGYKKVQARSPSSKEKHRSESDIQRMMQGALYTLTLFSGSIVTLEIPRRIEGGKLVSNKEEGGAAKDKKRNELLMFKNPLIICPTPIADMLLDLRKNHERLDRLLGFDRELSKKELNLKGLKISSPYTLHLLLNHSKIDPSLAAILWENIRDLKVGSSPEKVIENLRNTLNLTVTGNYLGDAIPRKSVILPL